MYLVLVCAVIDVVDVFDVVVFNIITFDCCSGVFNVFFVFDDIGLMKVLYVFDDGCLTRVKPGFQRKMRSLSSKFMKKFMTRIIQTDNRVGSRHFRGLNSVKLTLNIDKPRVWLSPTFLCRVWPQRASLTCITWANHTNLHVSQTKGSNWPETSVNPQFDLGLTKV